ncbi:uncharacterized protein FRV6_16703 [Fusarium oxysporum]|uniref:Uncharacterized protein n=1 Tax=Fusarium oxysporum TaxID=5507 RepID=A0A2H3TY65_FUSOX|nr:uncharacterized protein FRV6_16703 [Fusarium oxysporum]
MIEAMLYSSACYSRGLLQYKIILNWRAVKNDWLYI